MTFRILIIFYLVFFSSITTFSQEIIDGMVTYNYTTEDGLPSNQVLFSMQDSKGYMWFGTGGGGAVRYDGANFEVFDVSDGLLSNEVYNIYEDYLGRIWFSNYELQFCYLENGQIHEYIHNEVLRKKESSQCRVKGIHYLPSNHLIISFHDRKSIKVASEGIIIGNSNDEIDLEIILVNDSTSTVSLKNVFFQEKKYQNSLTHSRTTQLINIPKDKRASSCNLTSYIPIGTIDWLLRCISQIHNKKIYILNNHYLTILDLDGNVTMEIPILESIGKFQILNFNIIDNEIWIMTLNNGVFIGEIIENQFIINRHILKKRLTTSLTIDNEKSIWLTSHTNGIYYIPSPNNKSISKSANWSKNQKNLCVLKDNFFIYAESPDEISIYKDNILNTISLHEFDQPNIQFIETSKNIDDVYIKVTGWLLLFSKNDGSYQKIPSVSFGNNISNLSGDQVYLASNFTISGLNNNMVSSLANKFPHRILDIEMNGNLIGVATADGYYECENTNDTISILQNLNDRKSPFLNRYINELEPYDDGLWLASNGYGLGFYRDSLVLQINETHGLNAKQINDLTIDEDTLWVSTNNGLSKLIFNSDISLQSIEHFTINNGLSSNEIAGVECSDNEIFISTSLGYDIIQRRDLFGREDKPHLKINSIRSISTDSIYSDMSKLNYQENDLRINYSAIQFNTYGTHKFRYRLLPQNEAWKETVQHELEFYDLIPNHYIFEIEINDNQGKWVAKDEITFTVNPPFWKTWWFITIVLLAAAFAIIALFKRRERNYRKKLEVENELRSLKGKALRAQVNPHFIFNTLNSIQNFVLQGDFEKSNKFITSFSKLIRMILLQSDKDSITLEDEVKMLGKYLMIEQMRFGNTFDYKITVDETINNDRVSIPPMLIQPFVENAIWHGLLDKNKQGLIEVTFSSEKSGIILCSVVDNGIGFEASKKIKNVSAKQRKSVGMSLTNNRLNELNKNNESNLIVKEIKDNDGKVLGTKVEIRIPITEK